jgi:hypothetical protein
MTLLFNAQFEYYGVKMGERIGMRRGGLASTQFPLSIFTIPFAILSKSIKILYI